MSFDINEVAKGMVTVVKDTVESNWKHVKEPTAKYLKDNKERLEELAFLRLSGEISDTFLEKRLKQEKKVLESQFLSLKIVSTAIAQKAANAAFDVLSNAINTALKLV